MTSPRPVVRLVRPEEYDRVGELTVQAYAVAGFIAETDPYSSQLRDAKHRAEHAELIVAVDPAADRVLGGVTFCLPGTPYAELSRDGEAEFRMLAVDPAAQGRGVGDVLVRACLDRAVALGQDALVLCSLHAMRTAHRIYQRHGFVRDPSRDWEPVPGIALICFLRTGLLRADRTG